MNYNSLSQHDHDEDLRPVAGASPNRPDGHVSPPRASLFLDDSHDDNTSSNNFASGSSSNGLSNLVQSFTSGRTKASYDMLEEDDFAADAPNSPTFSGTAQQSSPERLVHRPLPRQRRLSPSATTRTRSAKAATVLRSASAHSVALRHPTPDLQTLQGAYVGNVEHLEKTAERLSMTSSIEDAIKQLHDEQKRSDSRRSSLLESQGMGVISRQVSNASSIVEVNSTARSGGYSPAGFMMSPVGSFSANSVRGRSASKGSKFGTRIEPEFEGRPLDAFVGPASPTFSPLSQSASIPEEPSPRLLRTDSIPEQDEESTTFVQPMLQPADSPIMEQEQETYHEQEKPRSPSIYTVEQTPSMFEGFDGVHAEQQRSVSGQHSNVSENTQRRVSSGNRLTMMERPQSYADPLTGQQMVYYPAPVPMMLNLPQKLSKNPSSMARNKRRTQVMSTIPPAARKSAIWLPDVLESQDVPDLAPDDPAQDQEYVPQHQRTMMGGRRNTQDVSHLPPQLRASTFFDLPAPTQSVEIKEQSPMATLDSILDASAFAPVNAFTDHAFVGSLGAEVYGKENKRQSRSASNLLEVPKKRGSTFGNLLNRRTSSSNLLESENEKRRSTMPGALGGRRQPIDSDDDEEEDEDGDILKNSDEEDGSEEDIYHGPPTTLLAELQLRKQQQKQRTRPLTTAFPNGVHSTLLELDAVAQVEQKSRKQKRINLAWEDPTLEEVQAAANDDEDVPLGLLYSKKNEDANRPMGLMERREMEDNEPLSQRRDRLLGIPPQRQTMRASTMMNLSSPADNEEETLAQRVRRLKDEQRTSTGLPAARPVSGDFASEMMSQLGNDAQIKDYPPQSKTPLGEEEETLGQRRKRLQAEREARAAEVGQGALDTTPKPALKIRHSMADILQAHPATGSADRALSYQKPVSGLLHLNEKQQSKRASTMMGLNAPRQFSQPQQHRVPSGALPRTSSYNNAQYMHQNMSVPQFAQPSINGYGYNGMGAAMPMNYGYGNNTAAMYQQQQIAFQSQYALNMAYMNGMGSINGEPVDPRQIDMVERWRQSVMQ